MDKAEKPNIFAKLRAETDFMEWEVCDECNGIGSDENAHFWCHPCSGRGGTWSSLDPRVAALINVAEAAATALHPVDQRSVTVRMGYVKLQVALDALEKEGPPYAV